MGTTDILTILLVLAGILGVVVAWLAYRYGVRKDKADANVAKINGMIADQLKPIVEMHASINNRLDNMAADMKRQGNESHEMNDKLLKVIEQQARQATQIEVFWKDVGMEAAKVVHSPDPRRRPIDVLIDSMRAGTITDEEAAQLKVYLARIRDSEPGDDLGFPVHAGEQFACGVLLRTMDHIIEMNRRSHAK